MTRETENLIEDIRFEMSQECNRLIEEGSNPFMTDREYMVYSTKSKYYLHLKEKIDQIFKSYEIINELVKELKNDGTTD